MAVNPPNLLKYGTCTLVRFIRSLRVELQCYTRDNKVYSSSNVYLENCPLRSGHFSLYIRLYTKALLSKT